MNEHLQELEPYNLWRHFQTLCNTPRPSWQEETILGIFEQWADQQNLAHERDQAGNLLIRKPATSGHESAPGIVLQGHVDMVSEADVDSEHDFSRDPIQTYCQDGWLRARGTTLGADNGIGVAAALAILEDKSLEHGPLEVLLTFAEEVSLVGARRLAPNWLSSQILLNLDTEEEGELCIGCAGGASVSTDTTLALSPLDADTQILQISISGLTGGHSGIDIHKGLANANRLLARTLHALVPAGLRLIDYDGGRMDNAITRAATATVSLPADANIAETLEGMQATLQQELAGVDDQLKLTCQPGHAAQKALSREDSRRLISLLYALPYGAERMSHAAPGVVETSNNIGVVQLHDGRLQMELMVRSLVDSARDALVERLALLIELAGLPAQRGAGYPGWQPQPDSPLITHFEQTHQNITGQKPVIQVIHAGLECGLIGAQYPGMDMISFGPTIRGAHSPDERVDLDSVARFYTLLKTLIQDLAQSEA